MKRAIFIVTALFALCLMILSCEKPQPETTPADVTTDKSHSEVPSEQPEAKVQEQPEAKPMGTPGKALTPLERARGREIIWEDGKPIFVWDSLKDLPALDDVFTSQKEQPRDFKFATHQVQEVVLPETEERKRLVEGILDENEDQLTAIISANKKCIVEIYQGTPPPDNRQQKWIRGIDPVTKEVLWKYDEPALSPSSFIQFAWDAERFILTDIRDEKNRLQLIKSFSCRDGYLNNAAKIPIDEWQITVPPFLSSDGKVLLNLEMHAAVLHDENGIALKRWEFGEFRPLALSPSEDSAFVFIYLIEGFENKPNRTSQFVLLDLNNQTSMWEVRLLYNLGDDSFYPTNYSMYSANSGEISAVRFTDPRYMGFGRSQDDPESPENYNNIALLITHDGIPHAFNLTTVDFTLSDNGKYIAANGKFYESQR